MVERGECGDERKRKRGEVIEGNKSNVAERGESCGWWKEGSVITTLTVVSMHCHGQKHVKFGDERKRKRGRRGIHFRAAHVMSRRHSSQRRTCIRRYKHVLRKSCGRAT